MTLAAASASPLPAPAVLDIPEFLDRRKNPAPMTDPHRLAVLQLSRDEALRVWTRCREKNPSFPSLPADAPDGEGAAAKGLLLAALRNGNGQADLVMAIVRDNTPVANAAAEKLTGRPIQRLPEKGAHAPRASRATKSRPSQTFQGDDQVITVLADGNPRKAGTRAALLFALYRTGMTVAEYVTAGGGRGNVKCDLERGNIALAPAKKGGA